MADWGVVAVDIGVHIFQEARRASQRVAPYFVEKTHAPTFVKVEIATRRWRTRARSRSIGRCVDQRKWNGPIFGYDINGFRRHERLRISSVARPTARSRSGVRERPLAGKDLAVHHTKITPFVGPAKSFGVDELGPRGREKNLTIFAPERSE
jgi:hypothetical protein